MKHARAVLALCAVLGGCAPLHSESSTLPPAAHEKCDGVQGYAESFDGRRTFTWRPQWLNLIKTDASAHALRVRILARAEQSLVGTAPTVMAKWGVPPSGDRHDYLSWPVYWWEAGPNEYEARDGVINPESKSHRFDASALKEMQTRVTALSLGYFLNGDHRYSRKASELLAAWFVDPATAMNPNLDFSQMVPGKRPPTTIESTRLVAVVEAIGLLDASGDFPPEIKQALETWFSRYVDWMTGPRAPGDRLAANNWALSYDLQLVEFALFAGRIDVARAVVERVPRDRIAKQISADGRLPAETSRTHGLNYSIFALGLLFQLADLGECLDVDLWSYQENGTGIRRALDFLIPFVGHEDKWPYEETKDREAIQGIRQQFKRVLLKAGWVYRAPGYFADAAALAVDSSDGVSPGAWPPPTPDYLE